MEREEKQNALAKAAHALNAAGICWAVGASALLSFEGISDGFNDLDLLITSGQMAAAWQAMRDCGAIELPSPTPSPVYATAEFDEYRLDGVDFDLLCGFAIRYEGAVYRYPFSADRIAKTVRMLGETVPLSPLADWFVLYQLMPGRTGKAEAIARYLRARPQAEWAPWLADWLSGPLPDAIRSRVLALRGDAER
ncbi:MAG: hypothetical protein LLF96_07205 [Eubacteriales bacterium]|nr:hypothetical protein [Eubacteriales bacterium]